MKIRKIGRFGIGLLSAAVFSGLAWADTEYIGRTAMPLTQEGGTARAMSMGSAVVAVPQGSASLLWNPAGLGKLDCCTELGLHHNSGLGQSNQETAVFGLRLGVLGGVAGSVNYMNNGTFDGRDSAGTQTGNYTAKTTGASLGWGKEFFAGISAGAAVKYNRQTLDQTSYSAFAADLGLLWNPVAPLNLGLTYSNLGTKVADRYLDQGWRVGASYDINKKLLLAASTELKPGGFGRLQTGIEGFVHRNVALRAGYVYNLKNSNLDGLTGVTAGAGIKILKNTMLDYAYLPFGELGVSHRVSLTFKFSCEKNEAPAKQAKAELKPAPVVESKAVIFDKVIVLEDTHFEHDSVTLTNEGVKVVIENSEILRENPKAKIRVAGFASASGTQEYNQKLSERRAKAVKEILISEGGIAQGRLTTIGYGEMRPAMHEATPDVLHTQAAKANKRVLFEVIVKEAGAY